jgi:hypothetical protein
MAYVGMVVVRFVLLRPVAAKRPCIGMEEDEREHVLPEDIIGIPVAASAGTMDDAERVVVRRLREQGLIDGFDRVMLRETALPLTLDEGSPGAFNVIIPAGEEGLAAAMDFACDGWTDPPSDEPLWRVTYTARPVGAEKEQGVEVRVDCWIRAETADSADVLASTMLEMDGWTIVKRRKAKPAEAEGLTDVEKDRFEYAAENGFAALAWPEEMDRGGS